jgi:hypothetical protein
MRLFRAAAFIHVSCMCSLRIHIHPCWLGLSLALFRRPMKFFITRVNCAPENPLLFCCVCVKYCRGRACHHNKIQRSFSPTRRTAVGATFSHHRVGEISLFICTEMRHFLWNQIQIFTRTFISRQNANSAKDLFALDPTVYKKVVSLLNFKFVLKNFKISRIFISRQNRKPLNWSKFEAVLPNYEYQKSFNHKKRCADFQ